VKSVQQNLIAFSALMVVVTACATITTHRANLAEKPDGVRVYPSKVYLFVDEEQHQTTIVYAPDFSRAYDIKPLTVLAKQDFKIEMEDSQLKTLTSNQDTTSIIELFKTAAQLGAKAAGLGVSAGSIKGTFGLKSGIYVLNDDGVFQRVQ
jgi:hypothetical protein